MKKLFIITLFTFLIQCSLAQKYSIVGAWYWSDSTQAKSLFFDQDGGVSMHTGLNNNIIFEKQLRKGKWVFKNNTLLITWEQNNIERNIVKFIDRNILQLSLVVDKQNHKLKSSFIFKRIMDEEVIQDKIQ
ncbi:hypothetical protein [Ferruginibacter sp.]|nr:hypothetical protein [Ferruginibacter sp.]